MAKIVRATTENRQELGKLIPLKVPFTCEIFPTNVCNFKCIYCAQSCRGTEIPREYMDIRVFQKCIDDLTEFPYKLKLLLIAGLGEPLLHPEIAEMVRYAKDKQMAETVRIITNASLLTPAMSDKLIAAGLDHLKISIQGLTDDMYTKVGGVTIPVSTIVENIRYFYAHKKHTVVNVKIVADAFESERDEERFYAMFGDICDTINIEHISPYQDVDYTGVTPKEHISQTGTLKGKNKICQMPFYFMSVYPDGEIIPCCLLSFEKYKKFTLGNVKETNISSIWTSCSYNTFRLMHLRNERYKNDVCRNCEEAFTSQCQPGDDIDKYADALIPVFERLCR